uniref:FAM86 N-terminal domain-containing protein n=1 Tax=Tetradesmus obliquus TaxID=3088 RepID=A0A383VXQ9_TETOB|eukprot:jgi/Sobl393_1/4805/SZX70257.1
MSSFKLQIKGWEDGERVDKILEKPDRWQLHSADQVIMHIDDMQVVINQKPHEVTAKKLGVGACAWEGEMLLAAYLMSAVPAHRYTGMRVLELGSGPGLAGLLAAKLGARVVITDKAVVVPLISENIALNGIGHTPTPSCSGTAEAEALEWGAPGYEDVVRTLASRKPELVLAADCCYIDQDGESPSTPHFIAACRGLCGPDTRVLVSFELRSNAVKETFLAEAAKAFTQVRRVPVSSLPKCYRVEYIELYELKP